MTQKLSILLGLFCSTLLYGADKPNILLILADDLGKGGLHCYGTEYLETPHIDSLAANGMKFTNGLAPYPTCKPSRAAILSGQYGPRTEVFRVSSKHKGFEELIRYNVPESKTLPMDGPNMAKSLKAAGYATAMFGKWHVDNEGSGHPVNHGFDEAISSTGHYSAKFTPEITVPEGSFAADLLTGKGIDFIKKSHAEGKPFFLFMPYYLVHKPLEARKDYIELFEKKISAEIINNVPKGKGKELPVIAAMTKMLDDCVGRLSASLKELGIEENTLVIFTSDNGAYTDALTGGLRGQKGFTYEGGLQVPYIFSWPGQIPAASSFEERVTGVDLFPTMLEVSGAHKPDAPLDGLSLASVLRGKSASLGERPVFCCYPKYARFNKKTKTWGDSWRNVIHLGDYKLIQYPEYDSFELFNLKDDPKEEKDLSASMPEKRQELNKKLQQWLKDVGAPELIENSGYTLKK
jgi:arylsulfatase A-like enzyme